MRTERLIVFAFALILSTASLTTVFASEEAEVRGTVQRIFQQLKARDYSSLYDSLPSSSKSKMTRERFVSALQRAQGIYALDRMDVGTVKVANNIAVVDTVLYGRLMKPFDTEGKIVVQQYLVREEGNWRVATGDTATTRRFLQGNPAFARKFPIKQPRIYVKQNGSWVEFTPPRKTR